MVTECGSEVRLFLKDIAARRALQDRTKRGSDSIHSIVRAVEHFIGMNIGNNNEQIHKA